MNVRFLAFVNDNVPFGSATFRFPVGGCPEGDFALNVPF